MKIEEAIRQEKPFKDMKSKAVINCIYTASWLQTNMNLALKPFKISMQQYNILRILKGQNPKSASIKLLQERMLDKMSNSSRLVDKLVDKKLVDRIVCPNDRRRVEVSINQNGLLLLEAATNELDKLLNQKLTNFTFAESAQLSDLLDKFRS